MSQELTKKLGYYGAGLEWTDGLDQPILEHLGQISCIELIPENFLLNQRKQTLETIGESGIPTMIHSVELSIGSAEPLKEAHLDKVLEIADQVNTINLSDHLCMVEAGGIEIGQLTTLPWTIECADMVVRKIDAIQKKLKVPFLIENITNTFQYPNNDLTETAFINRILDRTDSYLLIDLNNIYTNSINYKFDPHQWIDEVNLEKVAAVHLAGGFYDEDGTLNDGHNRAVPKPVFDLFDYLCSKVLPSATIVERTGNYPDIAELLTEVQTSQKILDKYSPMGLTLDRAIPEGNLEESA